MKKFIAVSVLIWFLLGGRALAVNNVAVVDRGWNKIDLGVLFPDWAKPFCEIFSLRNSGRWISNKILNTSQSPLYGRCREKQVVAPTPTASPEVGNVYNIPVLVLKYFPLDPNDPSKLNRNIVGGDLGDNLSLANIRQKITNLNLLVSDALERGSTYHGYKDSGARPELNYKIFEEKEFLKAVPVLQLNQRVNPPDHYKILKDEGFDICNLVDDGRVKEVWIWMYHNDVQGGTAPVESYQIGPSGGLGNGFMNLPACAKTYTVYDYNYGRGLGEAIEDHGHHIEAVLRSADTYIWDGKFIGQCGSQAFYRCGWTHYPPNVMQYCFNHDYDWSNEASVLSDCEDWKPDGSRVKKQVNCHNWAGATCGNDSGDKFKVWWMQNIPTNWWIWIYDFDRAKSEGLGLL